jgi:hypothetical protein
MEVIDIGLNDLEPINISFNDDPTPPSNSVNFGGGIELLMNDKKKTSSSSSIDLGELDKLENELNELSGNKSAESSSSSSDSKIFSGFSDMFGFSKSSSDEPKKESTKSASASSSFGLDGFSDMFGSSSKSDSNIGQATSESMGNTKTWDGFTKMNEVPLDTGSTRLSDREKRRKKRAMIKKLEEWYEKGLIKQHSNFTLESSYEEIEDEYETALEDKRKKDSIKLQGWWFMTFVNSIEYANAAFNPFDINLDGWGEQITEDLDSYDEIFSELHDKYKGGKLAPEISLLLRMAFSAAVVNFTNKALSTATPGFNDVIKQSPELMKMFTNATVSSMSQQSPGFAFANNLMKESQAGPNANMGPPPAPVETKNMPPQPRPGQQMQFTNPPGVSRPDISMGRGSMFREGGVDMTPMGMSYTSSQPVAPSAQFNPPSQFNPPPSQPAFQPPQLPQRRPEMRGPQNTDIDNILAGLKTKTVDIHSTPAQTPVETDVQENVYMTNAGDDSMISISSLKDMQNMNMPKKSRRKQRSDKNTVSLDI